MKNEPNGICIFSGIIYVCPVCDVHRVVEDIPDEPCSCGRDPVKAHVIEDKFHTMIQFEDGTGFFNYKSNVYPF